ncbi:MAG: hypothetical protein HZB99_00370 [Candidatus Harrisonbacteria bacterium]|nr:hypothetical protein [Candidatus Harrisonbacteria bacterium]
MNPDKRFNKEDKPKEQSWEQIKKMGRPSFTIRKGVELGISATEIQRWAEEVITDLANHGNYYLAVELKYELENVELVSEEQGKQFGKEMYKQAMEARNYPDAAMIAAQALGEDSKEYKEAMQLWIQRDKERAESLKKKLNIYIEARRQAEKLYGKDSNEYREADEAFIQKFASEIRSKENDR